MENDMGGLLHKGAFRGPSAVLAVAAAAVLAAPVAEQEQKPPVNEAGLRLDGPTLEEFVAAGYQPENYPPQGYAEKDSPGLVEFRAKQSGGQGGEQT